MPVVQAHGHLLSPCHILIVEAAGGALGSIGKDNLTKW